MKCTKIYTKNITLEIDSFEYNEKYNLFNISFVKKRDEEGNLGWFAFNGNDLEKLFNFNSNTDDEELYKLLNIEEGEYGF